MTVAAWASAWSISAACRARSLLVEAVDRLAHPEPEVGRDLVVARARRVQAPGRLADQLPEPRLDVHVDVFERGLKLEVAALDFSRDCV